MSAVLRLTPAPSTTAEPHADPELIDRREFARLMSTSVPTIDRMTSSARVPRPLRLSRGCVRWRLATVRRWLDASEAAGHLLTRAEFERLRD